MYVRKKGRYYYLVEGMRTLSGLARQRVLQYLGNYQDAVQAVRKLKDREIYLVRLQALEGVINPDCWQTPDTQEQPVLSLISTVFDGCIGLDPTADEGKRVKALHHMTRTDNCLIQSWAGTGAVFMNPPFSQPFPFVKKLTDELQRGHITEVILLLKQGTLSNKGTGALLAPAVKCFWRGRLAYINPQTGEAINWVRQVANMLPKSPEYNEIPEITQVDELETFVGKKNKIWLWTAVNKHTPGVIAWVLGDRSSETFKLLWQIISCWHSFFYVTDGYPVYPCFINNEDHIVSKTYMTLVMCENSRFRHYLARLHRKTFCYSKSEEMLKLSIRLVIYYLKHGSVALRAHSARKFEAICASQQRFAIA